MSNVLSHHQEKVFLDRNGNRFPLNDKEWHIAYDWYRCEDLTHLKNLKLGPQSMVEGAGERIDDWEPVLVGVLENGLVQNGVVELSFPRKVAAFAVKYLKLSDIVANQLYENNRAYYDVVSALANSPHITEHIQKSILSNSQNIGDVNNILRDLSKNENASEEYRTMAALLIKGSDAI